MCCRISYTKVSHSSAQCSGALGVTSSEGASLPRTPDGAAVPGHGATKLYCSGYCSTPIYVPETQEKSVHELDYIGTLRKPGSWKNTIFDILLCSALKLWRPLTSSQKILPRALSELYKVCRDSG